jgi:hypothetical protein
MGQSDQCPISVPSASCYLVMADGHFACLLLIVPLVLWLMLSGQIPSLPLGTRQAPGARKQKSGGRDRASLPNRFFIRFAASQFWFCRLFRPRCREWESASNDTSNYQCTGRVCHDFQLPDRLDDQRPRRLSR